MDKNIEKLKELPKRASMRYDQDKKKQQWKYYNPRDGVYRKIDDRFPWTHVERILKKYKGKNVDAAFSAYCKIVDKCQQFFFWKELDDSEKYMRRYRHVSDYPYWYVDDNKCIQRYKPKKQKSKHIVYSHDIKWGHIHIESGDILDTKHSWRYQDNLKYEWGVIEGQIFEFDRKGDAYHRCYAEELSKKRRSDRKKKKEKERLEYSFLTEEEKDKIKGRETDIVIKESKGFDDVSFTNTGGRLNED